jgi:hypothetical protein
MGPNVGDTAYINFAETFEEPRCREVLVVGIENSWIRVLVRAKRLSEIANHFSHFEVDGKVFFVAEVELHQLKAFGVSTVLSLATGSEMLISKAKELEESGSELIYATASDREVRPPKKAKFGRKSEVLESSESNNSSSGSEDLGILSKAAKSWHVGDIKREKQESAPSKSKSRFALLENSKKREVKSEVEQLTNPALLLKQLKGGQDPLQTLLALQLAETLGKKSKKSKKRKSSSSSRDAESLDDSASSSGSSSHRKRGHARAIESYQGSRKRMFRKPLRYVKLYVKEVEKELGAEDRPYKLSEYGRKVQWGKQRSLQRCHFMLSEILTRLLKGQVEKAAMQTVLCLRSIHQAAIDGTWDIAWLLTHLPDPWTKPQWGGSAEELGYVTSYLKSMAELNKNAEKARFSAQGSADRGEGEAAVPPKKGKGKGKSRDKEKDKPKEEAGHD